MLRDTLRKIPQIVDALDFTAMRILAATGRRTWGRCLLSCHCIH